MNSFVEKFKEEVREYCEKLEAGLLVLEQDPGNHQVIDEIFRIMHSMKGSGGMFGFDLISYVTHDMESLFEIFRTGERQIDSEVIGFTLRSIDGIQNLMVLEPTEEHRLLAEKMKVETQQQLVRLKGEDINTPTDTNSVPELKGMSGTTQNTYFISFIPYPNIFKNGTNPLYLVDELNALGECNVQISFDQLPELQYIEPDCCYVSWNLFIATEETVDTLNDVFIFVAEHAEILIEKVSNGNVLHRDKLLADFLNAKFNGEAWNIADYDSQEVKTSKVVDETVAEPVVELKSAAGLPGNAPFGITTVDSVRVDSQKIDQYMNLVSELITTQSRLEEISSNLKNAELELVTESFTKLSRQLRENAFDMSLVPLQSIAIRFNRLIHDLSKSLDKEVVLVTEGLETELDKNIIEKLVEPLLHIIRNSLDHGIESREERLSRGKNPAGTISIKASTLGSYALIEIEDDGAGLDAVQIREKAIASGLLTAQLKLTDEDVFQLIFEPGFSTAAQVTDVSGRGVGMDVVRRRIHEMRGSIELASEKGLFTRIVIKLPLSLSIIDGLLTTVGQNYYVIPSSVVRKIYSINPGMLKKEFRQVVELEDAQIPYLNLHTEFEGENNLPNEQFVVVVSFFNQVFGLVVDEVIREYQAVIKPLGGILKSQDVFSGASILGTGQLALVIDTNKMIKKYS